MTCAEVETPYFRLVLDTTPPRVQVAAPGIVEPPDDLVALLTTSEPYGWLEVDFADAGGDVRAYAVARQSPTEARLVMPTIGLSPGGGMLTVRTADEVGNTTVLDWPLVIDAPRNYDIELFVGPAYDVEFTMAIPYAVETSVEGVFTVQTDPDHAYDVGLDPLSAYAVEVEVDNAQ